MSSSKEIIDHDWHGINVGCLMEQSTDGSSVEGRPLRRRIRDRLKAVDNEEWRAACSKLLEETMDEDKEKSLNG